MVRSQPPFYWEWTHSQENSILKYIYIIKLKKEKRKRKTGRVHNFRAKSLFLKPFTALCCFTVLMCCPEQHRETQGHGYCQVTSGFPSQIRLAAHGYLHEHLWEPNRDLGFFHSQRHHGATQLTRTWSSWDSFSLMKNTISFFLGQAASRTDGKQI